MKTVGIIGGLGPETTSKFYLEVIFGCQKAGTDNRPSILIQSVPIAYSSERKEILEGRCGEETLRMLIKAANNLVNGGVDFIVMPCNSLHVFIDEVRESVNAPVMSIIDAVVKFLTDKKVGRIGILSTLITKKAKLYEISLAKAGIECEFPEDSEQEKINEIILKVVNGEHGAKEQGALTKILDNFKDKGIENVLLACTDLQLAVPLTPVKIFDSMSILAQATIEKILENKKYNLLPHQLKR